MPEPESETTASTWPLTSVATRKRPPPGMASLAFNKQVEKYLLQFAGIAVDRRQLFGQFEIDKNLRGLELMLEQRERVANDLVRSVERNSVVEVREKLSSPLAISAARKLCCVILSSTGPRRASPRSCLESICA